MVIDRLFFYKTGIFLVELFLLKWQSNRPLHILKNAGRMDFKEDRN